MGEGRASGAKKLHNLRITVASMALFFFAFTFAGLLFTLPLLNNALQQILSFSWSYAQCVVTDTVGGVGQSVRPQVLYSYYSGDTRLQNVWVSPYESAQSFQSRFPIGKIVPCRFNAGKPSEVVFAVLPPREVALQTGVAFGSLIFTVLGCAGLWVVFCFWRGKAEDIRREADACWRFFPAPPVSAGHSTGEAGRTHSGTPAREESRACMPVPCDSIAIMVRFEMLAIMMLLCSAAVSALFFYHGLSSPFLAYLLLALAVVGAFLYLRFAIVNSRLKIWISAAEIHPGEDLSIRWRLYDRSQKVQHLAMALKGVEESVTYRESDGQSVCNVQCATFAFYPLMQAGKEQKRAGALHTRIPGGIMPTFRAENTAIIWTLVVKGEALEWPDIMEEYELAISPRGCAAFGYGA